MKVDITKNEYRALLEILQIADWIIYSYKVKRPPESDKYDQLEQKFYTLAEKMGLQEFIRHDGENNRYFLSSEFEDNSPAMGYIEEFADQSFWDELMERLSFRDLIFMEGEDAVRKMDLDERSEKLDDLRDKYYAEFKEHGLTRLNI